MYAFNHYLLKGGMVMSYTLTKGYSNLTPVSSSSTAVFAAYDPKFETNYSERPESDVESSSRWLYHNNTGTTNKAQQWFHIALTQDQTNVQFKGKEAKAADEKRVKIPEGAPVRSISLGEEGYDAVFDTNGDLKYTLGYWSGLNLTFEMDDLVTPTLVKERMEHLISMLTYYAGSEDRIEQLMYGKYKEID
jgi:hypothetical protein